MKNNSPWIFELNPERKSNKISKDEETDVAIVGAGIAGIATAFFTLENTDKKVIVVDKYKLAHGATGHNAGYLASYFEKPFKKIVEEHGLEKTSAAQKAIESAWEILDHMYTTAELSMPLNRFLGHMGLSTKEQVFLHLENNRLRKEGGLHLEEIRISKTAEFLEAIPEMYRDMITVVPHEEILSLLQTENTSYIACFSYQKGTMNSALFCEGIYEYLKNKYSDRFSFFEHTEIEKIILKEKHAVLDAGNHIIKAARVILCTNGFEHFTIINDNGLEVDTKFHHQVSGVVGYMSAYLETLNKSNCAISYFTDKSEEAANFEEDYFYLSRRNYEYEKGQKHNLISVGGPVVYLENRKNYIREYEYPEEEKEKINDFVKKNYEVDPNKNIDYRFTWHGLMGYTPNMIRRIGFEPKNNILLYNLGCNGVGILPSIYGGHKISKMLAGEIFPPSIFDPK